MTIAIDISPLKTGHRVRGSGFYIENLRRALLSYHKDEVFVFFEENLTEKVDVIHFPYFDPFFLTLPFIKRGKQVVTVHDIIPLLFPAHFPRGLRGEWKWKIQRNRLLASDRIITDSEASKTDIARHLGYPQDRIDVVPLAPAEHFHRLSDEELRSKNYELRTKFKLPENFALYVGDATWNKNLPNLIKAFQRLDVPLVLAGKALGEGSPVSDNPWNKDLREVQQLTKNNKQFTRLGFVTDEELVALYNGATFFIMPSLYEGFGLPVIESMACGTPVITTHRGSLSEVAGEAALIVDPENVSEITKAAANLFTDEKLRKELSKKGLRQASKLSWKKTADSTMKTYQKALDM